MSLKAPSRLLSAAVAALCLMLVVSAQPSSAHARGRDPVRPTIVGGRNADPGVWQSTVALLRADREDPGQAQYCAGTLVAPTKVLTAAHCVYDRAPTDVQIGVGYALDSSMVRYAVTSIATEPGWIAEVGRPHDLAVLELAQPVDRPPAALAAPGQDADGQRAAIAGWGNVFGGGLYAYPMLLQSGEFVIGGGYCADAASMFDPAWMLCADTDTPYVMSTCDGDSGGPMMSNDRLVGVVSFGPQSCRAESYFMRVSAERAWLDSMIAAPTSAPAPAPAPAVASPTPTPTPTPSVAPAPALTRPDLTHTRLIPRATLRRGHVHVQFEVNKPATITIRFVRAGATQPCAAISRTVARAGRYAPRVTRPQFRRPGIHRVYITAANAAGSHTHVLKLRIL